MPKTLSLILGNPAIRISSAGVFFFGFAGAATSPYLSIIGIDELGMADRAYALVMLLGAVVSVAASLLIGNLTDRLGSYRLTLIATGLAGVFGFGMVYLLPSLATFTISKVIFVPLFTALYPLIFANVRTEITGMPSAEMAAVNSGVRAVLSLSWVLVPGIVGAALADADNMLPSFLFSAISALACVLLFTFGMPKMDKTPRLRPTEPFFKAFSAFAGAGLWIRLVAIALITAMLHMNATVLPLIVTNQAGGAVSDVGVLVGIVAALEIVFIIFWGYVERVVPNVVTLVIGTVIYTIYLFLLGNVTAPWQAYALTVIAALGAAAIISIPVTYLQNLIADKPGLGSSLISVNMFSSAGIGAGLFALGTHISNYAGAAILAAFAGFVGAALVLYLDGMPSRRKDG
ncbi:MFS transporter [Martelella endophytica]|uniref:Major facilitator transporter n=1 Tax=Martelella endophytica TaxID=1486262 RepID=A0A0D5LQ21_MAREN|nr:MFS transporter [Martelella endophytica]AJY46329.1 major facilitator transporter [Martelella endophytica]